ncbi:MAG TPA: V-type ATPase subunit subunit G family protein [Coriobacteriia bacterium]|nr:V-type ATPase subunit subunit G family protein [Coriobacteriia bacterium]
MDDNVVEELEFHKATVQSDDNSPLHLIREKEMEISGRVLSAKREADEIVSNARREASGIMSSAQDQASEEAGRRDAAVKVEIEKQMAQVRANAEAEAAALEEAIDTRRGPAVAYIVDAVTRI